jgi:hypothetical protein
MLFICSTSIGNNFISENGIVAVLGDENQFVKGGTWKIICPSHPRGGILAKSGEMTPSWLRESGFSAV